MSFWTDYFQSGEVIDSLALYLASCERPDFREDCKEHVFACVRFFETNQVDGKWGAHVDTCRALFGYLRATHVIPELGQEHHLVMKALRWMCDEKQAFSDGSFLHTPFITVFYAGALWQAINYWKIAQRPVAEVYDISLWSTPVRATEERGLRLALQIEQERLQRERQRLQMRLGSLRDRSVAAATFAFVLVVGALFGALLDLVRLSVASKDSGTFAEYAAVVLLVASGLSGLAARVAAERDDR